MIPIHQVTAVEAALTAAAVILSAAQPFVHSIDSKSPQRPEYTFNPDIQRQDDQATEPKAETKPNGESIPPDPIGSAPLIIEHSTAPVPQPSALVEFHRIVRRRSKRCSDDGYRRLVENNANPVADINLTDLGQI